MSSSFDEINRLLKRALHFCGPKVRRFDGYDHYGRKKFSKIDWSMLMDVSAMPRSLATIFSNYSLMRADDDSYFEKACWLHVFAKALNRWIDGNRVDAEPQAKLVLNWWRDQLFFDPMKL